MTTVRDIYNALFAFAPASMKMDWDNVGLLCGRFDAPVDTVLVALDPMPDVIDEATQDPFYIEQLTYQHAALLCRWRALLRILRADRENL